MGRERDAGGPGIAADDGRAGRIPNGELSGERPSDDRDTAPTSEPEDAHDRPLLGRLGGIGSRRRSHRLEEERLDGRCGRARRPRRPAVATPR